MKNNMKLLLSKPRGFCAGVERAIDTVEKALKLWGAPIYVKHEIVHNRHVVDDLKAKGAIFIGFIWVPFGLQNQSGEDFLVPGSEKFIKRTFFVGSYGFDEHDDHGPFDLVHGASLRLLINEILYQKRFGGTTPVTITRAGFPGLNF